MTRTLKPKGDISSVFAHLARLLAAFKNKSAAVKKLGPAIIPEVKFEKSYSRPKEGFRNAQ
ncbi:hypothetical protein BDF20DRAFT_886885, partial [Mycotypha africana]|uniref:uncharacterized protein n=1 Tax=Mycotypha africana TaxID=64632 RepID=UPI002301194F